MSTKTKLKPKENEEIIFIDEHGNQNKAINFYGSIRKFTLTPYKFIFTLVFTIIGSYYFHKHIGISYYRAEETVTTSLILMYLFSIIGIWFTLTMILSTKKLSYEEYKTAKIRIKK